MLRLSARAGALLASLLAAALPLAAQADSTGFIRIYLDCPDTNCDLDYFRREVAFVDYVRDPADAQVHILLTEEDTGGGGEAFTATFIDRRPGGRRDTLQYFAPQDATDDAERKGIARMLRLGLVPFVARTPAAARLEVFYDAGVQRAAAPAVDRWNNWVFRVRGSGYVESESRFDGIDVFGGVSAQRTTAELKLGIAFEGSYERDRFELDSVTTVTSTQESYGVSTFAVRSLGGHWGARVAGAADRSSYRNRKLGLRALVGLEYDVFPYRESASRLLTLRYEVGVNRYRYDEATLFQKTSETLFAHSAEVSLDATQPWGSVGIGARAYQYLDDLGSNSLRISGDLEIRLLRGLSLELDGSVSRIRDQRYLPAEGLSPEEILLRQQELATDYRVFFALGLSYSFGSIYNNVVNPRFGDGDAFF